MTSCEHCDRPVLARGWCAKHYARWRAHGDPLAIKTLRGLPDEDRFWRQVERTNDCWLWTGPVVKTYGHLLKANNQRVLAHRFAYELLVGPIPEGLEVDHLCHDPKACLPPCRHRLCVNPAHLEAVTRRENNLRSGNVGGVNAAKTHCPRGHAYSAENTIRGVHKSGSEYRRCRTCARETKRRSARRAQAARTA